MAARPSRAADPVREITIYNQRRPLSAVSSVCFAVLAANPRPRVTCQTSRAKHENLQTELCQWITINTSLANIYEKHNG